MKNFIPALILFLALFVSSSLHSQSPQGIPYQAVMRNADGSVMASSAVNLTFMIHDGTANGTMVYQESHALTSNAQGLVSCVVGNGVVSQGNFADINWGSGAKFLHVMMGSIDLGTQQMLSVPYALHSSSADNAVNATNAVSAQTAANGFSSVSTTGDTLYMANGSFIIVPGISAANSNNGGGGNNTTSGLGSIILPGNFTCADQFISVNGCNGQTSLTYDGRTYDLVEIGGQCWFADNLATDQYRNGDLIPTGLSNTAWGSTTSGAYAIYNNDPVYDLTYGKLYNWYTTVDSRGLCPTGWHVPTDCEWMYLEGSLGMSVNDQETEGMRGTNEGGAMKAIISWNSPNTGATNESGFTGLAGGSIQQSGTADNIGNFGYWWSSTDNVSDGAWYRLLNYNHSMILRYASWGSKRIGFSVRCIKDSESSPIQGCTDGAACNFMANANQDDGSCLYQNATCDDGNANTTNDVINGSCVCAGTQASGSGTGAQLLPGNATCATQNISVTGCGGQTSLTYDGRTYDLVEIGGQCWFADNLATDQYRNGDLIPTGLDNATWQTTTAGAYAIYNNDPANDATYGKLYNWYTTVDSRGLCPTGWHVPSDCEWMYLEGSLGMSVTEQETVGLRGTNEGGAMKATTNWTSPNTGATNSIGFTAFPGGCRNFNGTFNGIGYDGYWRSSTEYGSNYAWHRGLFYEYSNVYRYSSYKQFGFSVRCVRD